MGLVVFILGRSGTGKSYSMRDFNPDEIAIINIQGKILPFRNGANFPVKNTDDAVTVVNSIKAASKKVKTIVVDDFQYLMANEFMRRSTERGFDKFTEIARHAWDVVNVVRELPADCIVYIMCHTDTDNEGVERLKTIGKMLDEKIVLEGMSTIVLKSNVSDGSYTFLTQNNGKDTVKSPAGMFPAYAIDNNLKYVDEKIRNYYGMGECLSDAEMKVFDESAAKPDVTKPDEPRHRRRTAETAVNVPTTAETVENDNSPVEVPTRRRRSAETAEITPTVEESTPTVEGIITTNETAQVYTPVEAPARRRRLTRDESAVELPFDVPDTTTTTTDEEPTPRRRRRRSIEQ